MKDYYAILGLERTASDGEIKRAYRRLAVAYHPDKNPNPEAENLFKEINEAYDVIGDPTKKRGYDYLMQYATGEVLDVPARPHRDPAYHRERRTAPPREGERERIHAFMRANLPVANLLSIIAAAAALVFMLDFILPRKTIQEKITETTVSRIAVGRSHKTYWTITTGDGRRFEFDIYLRDYFQQGGDIKMSLSRLLNVPVTVEGAGKRETVRKSIYANFSFAPIALAVSAVIALIYRKDVERGFNYGIVAFLSLLLAVAIFLILHQ